MAAALLPTSARPDTFLLIVSGVGGEESYSQSFYDWSKTIFEAASAAGIASDNITYLAEDPARDPVRIREISSKENIQAVLAEILAKAGEDDELWVILFGHGSSRRGQSRFNLPGPDMSDEEFAVALENARVKTLAFVDTSSASAGFLSALSSEGRVIVTATRSAAERLAPIFGAVFAEAFVGGVADVDKDERVSLLEAFRYARIEVERRYRDDGRLLTEHALLDDNGDGEGSLEPAVEGLDGSLASRVFFARSAELDADASLQLASLLEEKERLEVRIGELRRQKDSLEEDVYLQELETLLLALARTSEDIRSLSPESNEPSNG